MSSDIAVDAFWPWLAFHTKCIVRVSMQQMALVDHEEFHWTLFHRNTAAGHVFLVELSWGKGIVGQLSFRCGGVVAVHVAPEEDDEWSFHCCDEQGDEVCRFVMSHGFEEGHHQRQGDN